VKDLAKVGMIPSVYVKTNKGKVLVRYDWEFSCKKNSAGRRIPHTTRPVKLHGIIVSRMDKSCPKTYPPGTSRDDAVKDYIKAM